MLISFDGLDSSGKETQVKTLVERFIREGRTVRRFQTPDYTTPSGQELKARLQNKIGQWEATSWRDKAGFFASNRLEHKSEVDKALSQGEIVIYDRYIPSSLTFMAVEAGLAAREEVYAFIRDLEYTQNNMPPEALSVFLDVPPRVAIELLNTRKQVQYEADEYTDQLDIQEKLYEEYQHLCGTDPDHYIKINCVIKGQLRSIQAIHEDIYAHLKKSLENSYPTEYNKLL